MLPCCFIHIRVPASSFLPSYVHAAMDLQLCSGSLLSSLIHLKTMACLLTCSIRLNQVMQVHHFRTFLTFAIRIMKWLLNVMHQPVQISAKLIQSGAPQVPLKALLAHGLPPEGAPHIEHTGLSHVLTAPRP